MKDVCFSIPEHLAPEAEIGGKAAGLLALEQAGLRVPPWRVMDVAAAAAGAWRVQDAELRAMFAELSKPPFYGVAVRSSSPTEDGREASHAGVFETVIVDRPEELLAAVEKVVASSQSDRAVRYGGATSGMAVIAQACVAPKVAGVAFSADPSNAISDTWYCEAVHGLGDALVDGESAPSRFWVSLESGQISKRMKGSDGPDALDEAILHLLSRGLAALEDALDTAVDIEWAMDETGLWFLQARPVTRLAVTPPDFCATSWFFDQRFNEPIHPFTRTTLLPLIRRVAIDEALRMRGETDTPAFHFHGGQAYLPHAVYRRMLRGAPHWWLSPDLRALRPERCACPTEPRSLLDTLWYAADALTTVLRDAGDVFFNVPRWDAFRAEVEQRVPEIMACPESDWRERWNALDAVSVRFLQLHRWSILWADYGYKLIRFLPPSIGAGIESEALASARLITTEANRALAAVADGADMNPFIQHYGHRSGSLDYAVPTWAELAEQNALPHVTEAGGVPAKIKNAPAVLRLLVRMLEMREEQRFTWERILAAQREIALARGQTLAERGQIRDAGDVWFLTRDEVWADNENELCDRIAARRHARRLECLVERPFLIGPAREVSRSDSETLSGLGASAGQVDGVALCLSGPDNFDSERHRDAILVLPALDPAWTHVLPQIRGLVIERGGMLSHASVLAREYGVPLVIGVADATKYIETGTRITLDGYAGTVEITPPKH